MKLLKLNLILLLLAAFSCEYIVGGQVPEAVQKAFQQKYPGENDPDWHLDKNGYWEANFKQKGTKFRADYRSDGQWIETESNIDEDDLPDPIREVIKDKYDDYKIEEVEMVMHYTKGTFYDVEFKIKGEKVDIEFDTFGNRIN